MPEQPDIQQIAGALRMSIGLLLLRIRQTEAGGELRLPETSALALLDRGGPATPTALACLEQISPQSMGATLASLEDRGLVRRRSDPEDGRRVIVSITDCGLDMLRNRRAARTERLTTALSSGFTRVELKRLAAAAPLLERLAQSL
jgi:DNA-binding MarR family transcriptional regulator